MTKTAFVERALAGCREKERLRCLQPLTPDPDNPVIVYKKGKPLVSFCSNDYLGLSVHPKLKERAAYYARSHGAGATGSRLVSGTFDIHVHLEEKLASLYESEAALVFNSGFQANATLIAALADRSSLVLADKLCHNSLIQGALLSRSTFRRYRHRDSADLERLLQETSGRYERVLIVTESIFSMDGDCSELDRLITLAQRHDALLLVDDAHAVGVWGERGLGLTAKKSGIDLAVGTFGKAFGSFGAFVICNEKLKQYLVNFCPGFIYTTALPPPVIGSIEAGLELVPDLDREREHLHELADSVRARLHAMGFDTLASTTQIIPLLLGDERQTLGLSAWLERNGILATAIRPPTVGEHKSRIRIALSSHHGFEHIEHFLKVLQSWDGSTD